MRALFAVAVLGGALGCSKCSADKDKDKAAADAAVTVAAVTAPDAAVDVADAGAAAAEPDGGLDEATLVAAYARDCSYVVEQSYYTIDQDQRGDECIARNVDQSCAPDLFDCYAKGEECRDACGDGCQECAKECAGTCDGCRAECAKLQPGKREACITTCARSRLACRNDCIAKRASCLTDSCAPLESTCEDEGERKRKKACPDCAELGSCMWEDGFKEDHAKCLDRYPENAKECLEWCFQE